MATKSSIHIKPCNIASSEAHNRRTAEYMRNIGESRIYVVPELIPTSALPNCGRTMTISSGWSRKRPDVPCRKRKGNARERMERLSRWRDVHPFVKESCSSDRTPHWLMYANSVKSVKDDGASLRYKFSCTKTKGIG